MQEERKSEFFPLRGGNIRKEILEIKEEIIQIRRKIHQNPQSAFNEHETGKLIIAYLENLGGFEIKTKVGKTGIVAILQGKNTTPTSPCWLLRADMDALVQVELLEVPYKSTNGCHHGCGHDGHVAMLLGAAKILSKIKDQIKGTIKFCFQPAEEKGPGSREMINDPVYPIMENPKVHRCFGMHLAGTQKYPIFASIYGPTSANSDRFKFTVNGRGGHASTPHKGIDSILTACHLVTSLDSIITRGISPYDSAVIMVGKINGGSAPNIMANQVEIEGTVRTRTKEHQELIMKRMKEVSEGVGKTFGSNIELEYSRYYHSIINDQETVDVVRQSIGKLVEYNKHHLESDFGLIGEDFSYFSSLVPSAFITIGCIPEHLKEEEFSNVMNHSPYFDIDENALLLGASFWVELVQENFL